MMRKLSIALMAVLLTGGMALPYASTKTGARQERTAKAADKKASKTARKEAKQLKKAGWQITPGALPLEQQLDRAYEMQNEFDSDGTPKYIIGSAMSLGETYDAAKMQALELAKHEIASQLVTQIKASIENTVLNKQLEADDALSITKTSVLSDATIANRIGRTLIVIECYRDKENTMKEAMVRVAYDSRTARQIVRQTISENMEKQGMNAGEALDKIFEGK